MVMITNVDITKLKAVFATKDDLKEFAKKDDLVNFKDEILKEIRDMRADNILLTGYKDQIEDHDLRIEHIEKHLHLAPLT